jgi:hypothetical protein
MPTDTESHSRQMELLLNAAFAIRSSEAAEGHHDLGTRLAIRMLLPYAKPDGDSRVTATIGEILEHHTPESDAEARTLLSLCRSLVERKSVRVLDGCVSVALSRYRYYLADQRPGGAVHWLVTGMELESLVLCGPSMSRSWQRDLSCGVCYRMLATRCLETAQLLLKGILGEREGAALVYSRALEMVKSGEESKLVAFVPTVKVLSYVVGMAGATVERKDESIVASNIVSCLKETPSEEDDGVVSALAPTSMHWDLLRLANRVLDRNTNRNSMEGNQTYSAAFDVRGMQVLLERFTVIMATREVERLEPISKEDVYHMRLALGNGLMTAFVAENAKKNKVDRIASAGSVAGICAADLGKYSRDKQEKIVEMMLDI